MSYKDYFLLSGSELQHRGVTKEEGDTLQRNYSQLLQSNGISPASIDSLFAHRMNAVFGAAPLDQKFPLIIVAQGNYQSIHHQAVLCEYLASLGFVVITSPSQTRITGQMRSDDEASASMSDQYGDMEFLLAYTKGLPYVDTSNIGLVGHSFGGRTIALFATNHPTVKAVVSLDGGIGLHSAVNAIIEHPKFYIQSFHAAVLHFYENNDPFAAPDLTLLESLKWVERTYVLLPHFHHFYFTSFGALAGSIQGLVRDHPGDVAKEWKELETVTEAFLGHIFKGEHTAWKKVTSDSTYAIQSGTD